MRYCAETMDLILTCDQYKEDWYPNSASKYYR
jgi:hypothetical protein